MEFRISRFPLLAAMVLTCAVLNLAAPIRAQEAEPPAETGDRPKPIDVEALLAEIRFGGYGEMHANFGEGDAADKFDIHRLVFYVGYDFEDWIRLHSEIEIEHAFVSDDDGELAVEQLHVDFLLSERANVRVGRLLTPLGIVNRRHEPPAFNGVERPAFATYIIPTTWSSDGIGLYGSLTPSVTYEAYVVGGLDGTGFSATKGIRDGRIKERPSLHEPAFTGRIDYSPFAGREMPYEQTLRLGGSFYAGGLDNGDEGENPDLDADIHIYSADFEYAISRFNVRGAVAHEKIDGAREIGGGTAEEVLGWYVEWAVRVWPEAWRRGKLEQADAVVFVRHDDIDTQYEMPSGVASDPAGKRNEWTFGVGFYLTPQFVIKADVQVRDDETTEDLATLLNFGVGWRF